MLTPMCCAMLRKPNFHYVSITHIKAKKGNRAARNLASYQLGSQVWWSEVAGGRNKVKLCDNNISAAGSEDHSVKWSLCLRPLKMSSYIKKLALKGQQITTSNCIHYILHITIFICSNLQLVWFKVATRSARHCEAELDALASCDAHTNICLLLLSVSYSDTFPGCAELDWVRCFKEVFFS